jgi:hypothetical protein
MALGVAGTRGGWIAWPRKDLVLPDNGQVVIRGLVGRIVDEGLPTVREAG